MVSKRAGTFRLLVASKGGFGTLSALACLFSSLETVGPSGLPSPAGSSGVPRCCEDRRRTRRLSLLGGRDRLPYGERRPIGNVPKLEKPVCQGTHFNDPFRVTKISCPTPLAASGQIPDVFNGQRAACLGVGLKSLPSRPRPSSMC